MDTCRSQGFDAAIRLWFRRNCRGLAVVAVIACLGGGAAGAESGAPAAPDGPVPAIAPASAESPAPVARPDRVKVGLYITSLHDFDMAKRSFNAVFWTWFRSADDKFKPIDSIEVVNARNVATKYSYSLGKDDVLPGGQRRGETINAAKYYVNISQDWNIKYFPFDRQVLSIWLEDSQNDIRQTLLEPDRDNSGIEDSVSVPGWTIEKFTMATKQFDYNSNFGDVGAQVPSYFSRVIAEITVKRAGFRLLCNVYTGFFVAFLLISLTYMMDVKSMVGNRIGLCGGAIFASVGNKYILDNALPLTTEFTLSDAIEISTFLAIIWCIVTAMVTKSISEKHETFAKRLNLVCAVVSFAGYLISVGTMIVAANS